LPPGTPTPPICRPSDSLLDALEARTLPLMQQLVVAQSAASPATNLVTLAGGTAPAPEGGPADAAAEPQLEERRQGGAAAAPVSEVVTAGEMILVLLGLCRCVEDRPVHAPPKIVCWLEMG